MTTISSILFIQFDLPLRLPFCNSSFSFPESWPIDVKYFLNSFLFIFLLFSKDVKKSSNRKNILGVLISIWTSNVWITNVMNGKYAEKGSSDFRCHSTLKDISETISSCSQKVLIKIFLWKLFKESTLSLENIHWICTRKLSKDYHNLFNSVPSLAQSPEVS